jgi:hypothetical protein
MLIRSLLFVVLLVTLAASGCIFSPPKDDDPPPPPPPLNTCAATPDALMQLFREIYSTRNYDAYLEILSENFLFVTENRTETYGYEEEIDIHYKMFNGLAGTDGIVFSNITVDELTPESVWRATVPEDEFFGEFANSQNRVYNVDFNFYVSGQDLRYRVQGAVRYYVMQEDMGNGELCYKYLGMEDLTFGGL